MINTIIANIIKYLHYLLILYVLTGFSYTPIQYLKYYLFLIIGIFLDWNDFDGQCTLTGLEHYFRFGRWNLQPAEKPNAPEFFRPVINKIFALNLDRNEASRLNNWLFMICFLFGFIKLLTYYNI